MQAPIRVFIACSLDGFIAGPDGDLSWLPVPQAGGEDYGYGEHMAQTAAILMGRSTYDAVTEMDPGGEWFYGETPLFVATHRPLGEPPAGATVHAVSGDPVDLVAAVQAKIGVGGIYADGGELIRQLLDAALIDELVVTVVPVILGSGPPLFAGAGRRHQLELQGTSSYENGLVQLRYAVVV